MPKLEQAEQAVIKRVGRRREEDEHGGAWKIAFADFCLALLCLFLVMWLLAVRQQENLQELWKAAGGRMFDEGRGRMHETIGGPRGRLIALEPAVTPGEGGASRSVQDHKSYDSNTELTELAQMILHLAVTAGLSENLRWVVTPYGLRVTLHDSNRQGMFEVGGAQPTQPFRSLLRAMGPLFGRIENQMLIVGHTDARAYADRGPAGMSNWMLSSERAMAARRFMLEGGMPERTVLQVVGLADGSPLNPADPSAAENRRIELLILTSNQARSLAALFGIPDQPTPLLDGVDTSLPAADALSDLRGQIGPERH